MARIASAWVLLIWGGAAAAAAAAHATFRVNCFEVHHVKISGSLIGKC